MNTTANYVAAGYRQAITLIAQGETLIYSNLTDWAQARRDGVSLSALSRACHVSTNLANAYIHLGLLVDAVGYTVEETVTDAGPVWVASMDLPERGWDALRRDVDAIARHDASLLPTFIDDLDGGEDLTDVDAWLTETAETIRRARKAREASKPDTGETETETDPGETEGQTDTVKAPTRTNAQLITEAMACLARVDALTMTPEDAAALSVLVKSASATGRAWQAHASLPVAV